LKPHVPGKVWGVCDAKETRGKPVVWLTADPLEWKHDRHPRKAWRNPDVVLLTVQIDWSSPKLKHFLSWRDPGKRLSVFCKNNVLAWFVHFGPIKPSQIVFEAADFEPGHPFNELPGSPRLIKRRGG
jgi:hypothetical protein